MRLAACLLLALSTAAIAATAAGDAYVAEIDKWRHDFETDIRTGDWLTLVNRVELPEGRASIGSDAKSTVVLPARAPKHFGSIVRNGTSVQFIPAAGVECSIDGKPVKKGVSLSTRRGTGKIQTGSIRLVVRAVGDEFFALVSDTDSPEIAKFAGVAWFSTDPGWRVSAQFVAYPQAESVRVPMTHVTAKTLMSSTGDVLFEIDGRQMRLKTFIDEHNLFIMFTDPTNGKDTYGGGRFIEAPLPKDGATTLDFNKAFNPYCSLNSNIMCPLVPRENRLDVRIVAGEKYTAGI
jgi:uncharacterized protein